MAENDREGPCRSAYLAGKATVATTKATGHALHGTAKFVGDHQQEIADATKAVVNVAGKLVEGTGAAMASGAGAASRGLHRAADESNGKTGRVLGKLGGYTADAVGLVAAPPSESVPLRELPHPHWAVSPAERSADCSRAFRELLIPSRSPTATSSACTSA